MWSRIISNLVSRQQEFRRAITEFVTTACNCCVCFAIQLSKNCYSEITRRSGSLSLWWYTLTPYSDGLVPNYILASILKKIKVNCD